MNPVKSETIVQHEDTYHCQLLLQMGDGCYAIEDFEQARSYYGQAALLDADSAGPYVGLGMLEYQNENLEDAELAFKVACRLDRQCSKGYLGMAMVAHKKDNYGYAFDMYLRSIECDSDNLMALLGLFQTSCKMGTFENIIRYLDHYLQSHQGDTSVMSCLASLYIRDNKFSLAKSMLDRILAIDPEDEVAVNLLEEVEYNLSRLNGGNSR